MEIIKRKKILHVLNSRSYSGAENVVINIIDRLCDEFDFAYLSPEGDIRNVLMDREIKYLPLESLSVKGLRKIIREFQPDIIHAHDFRAGIYASFATDNIPIINHLHNNPPWIKKYSIKTLLYLWRSKRFKKILTVSSAVMEEFIFGACEKNKTINVGNPFDGNRIIKLAEMADDKGKIDVAFLGRLTAQKNPFLFLKIVKGLKNKKPGIKTAMIGDGELKNEIQKMIKEYDLHNNVILYGFKTNPFGILKNSKVMCMPSAWEGFGLAALEGLALGKPVVCSGAGGLKDIVNDSCGKLCQLAVDAYIDELSRLLNDEQYYESKSNGASMQANRFSNVESYINIVRDIYNMENLK